MKILNIENLESKIIVLRNEKVLLSNDVAEIYDVETRDINQAVKNNPEKFPMGYVIELSKKEKHEVVGNFHHLSKLKYSPHLPKAFTEKGLYMLATILKSKRATTATLAIIEMFSQVKQLSNNINAIMKTTDETLQQLAQQANKALESIIEIKQCILLDEAIETTTEFEFRRVSCQIS